MKKPILFTFLLTLCLVNSSTSAAPYSGEVFKLKQPDGSFVSVKVWGDEYYQHVESLDGYTLVRDKKNKWICYAKLSTDKKELVSSGEIFGAPKKGTKVQKFKKHIKLPKDEVRQKALKNKHLLDVQSVPAFVDKKTISLSSPQLTNTQILGLTLLIDFPDEAASITVSDIQNYLNQEGYNGHGNNGSVYDFFFDISDGNLEYTNHVTNYYTANNNKSYYTDSSVSYGTRARELILEALNDLEQTGFDFSALSTESGDYIIAINAFYAGEVDNAWAQGLWPHKSSMFGSFSADGVKSGEYQITNIGTSLSLRTFCHENGHMVCNWPDMYDYGYESSGLGNYCLMASGSSNTNPIPPNPYLRDLCGWQTVTNLYGMNGQYQIVSNDSEMYRYINPSNNKEFYLVESFLQSDRYSACPDEGLAIWHIDEDGDNDNEQMTANLHYMVSLEQADNDFDLENNNNNGDSSDLFNDTNSEFSDTTLPDALWWDSTESRLHINNISAVGEIMSFSLVGTSQNHSPILSNPRVLPGSGTESTDFEFMVDYYDADGDSPDPIYRKVYISGGTEAIMTLKSGTASNGTYHYTTTLPVGLYSYYFLFADTRMGIDTTPWQSGPSVYSDGDVVINAVVQCTRISSDLHLRYSLTGSGGPWTDIPITQQILDPLVVPAGSTVHFQADVGSPNYEYREWEFYEGGSLIGSGTGDMWWVTLSAGTTELGLNVYYGYIPQNYTISGTVLLNDGSPVPGGVDLTLTSDEQTMSQNITDGNFSFAGVKGGVSVTVTPSASGHIFSPPSLIYNNLKDDHTAETIVAYSSDKTAPTSNFDTVPPSVGETSSISFSWSGSDDVSLPPNLSYQYKLDGVDADWSAWSSAISKGYNVENGAYIFWVRAQDEAGNINQAPISYEFVVNAAPKVISAVRTNRSVWASRVTLEMPVGASNPTNNFILLQEHAGMSDSELVPVAIHQVDEITPYGASEYVASELGVTESITKASTGYLVSLPGSIAAGQTAQYDIIWGKIKYFGWQEFESIPLNFPNVGQKYPPNYNDWSQVEKSYLDNNLRLWRTATKKIYFGTYHGESNASVLMNISNKNGPVVGETLLRYGPGTGWDGSYGKYTLYSGTQIVPVGSNMALLWSDLDYEYFMSTFTHVQKWRHGAETFNSSGSVIGSHDGTYAEHRNVSIPTRSIGDTLWFVDADDTTAAFWVLNSDCSEIIPKTTFETFTANDSFLNLEKAVQIENSVLLLWTRYWYTLSYDRPREQIMYQIRDINGNTVKTTTELSPPLLSDAIDKEDRYGINSILTDNSGKVWLSYYHIQSGQSTEYHYVIIGTNGNIWKGPIQTISTRNFSYCDKDGYVWATEGGQFFVLNDDDTEAVPPRSEVWIPNQSVGLIAASVTNDGYRLYDRWSPQLIEIDVPSGTSSRSMELFSLNLWENALNPSNINLIKGTETIWSQSGPFTGKVTVDVTGSLRRGENILTLTQDEFLGGQVLITFPYINTDTGDLTGNLVTSLEDLVLVAQFWLEDEPSVDIAPLNEGDGIINFLDFSIIARHWLEDNRPTILISGQSLDTNPGWTTEGEWAFGQPLGSGGSHGNSDPNSGYSGNNVYGVNLSGDYTVAVGGPYRLTAGPFDCNNFQSVRLKFARWLNTDTPTYIASKIEASNNGTDWSVVWEHTADSSITDGSWQIAEYDISSIADNQQTVYLRWSYKVLSAQAYSYSGWNIDDIELWGIQ